jgi:Zn-dependent peptidase ImmA (M78 family)
MDTPRIGFARTLARRTLKECRLTGPPVPIEEVLRFYGLALVRVPGDPAWSGSLQGDRVIVNAGHPDTRQRFTAAHELGHFRLAHWAPEEGIGNRMARHAAHALREEVDADRMRIREIEANAFAAELLALRAWVKAYYRKLWSPSKMASVFLLSQESMWLACLQAGCIKVR